MKKLNLFLLNMGVIALMPGIAGAAGTYYNGGIYQNPQARYSTSGGGYYNTYGAGRGYGQNNNNAQNVIVRPANTNKNAKNNTASKKQGFVLDAGLSHEFASWNFDMKNAGSKLHYDNLRWNVISGQGTYYFGDSTPMQIKFGARYGMQFDENPMVDDDITTEAMWSSQLMNVDGNNEYVISGAPALSVGTSKGGSQLGFNAAFGLTDFFKWGKAKLTPSVGYRYFKYKLSTEKNYGLMVDVINSPTLVNCLEVQPGEIQCSPYIGFVGTNGLITSYASLATEAAATDKTVVVKDIYGNSLNVIVNEDGSFAIYNNTSASNAEQLDVGNTYYYEQSGKTHIYETTWMGPYLALDIDYVMDENNSVTAGVEFGLPTYESKGDQPYRYDWAHPTSVKDKASFGDAYHLGLNAMWITKISDSAGLSFGFTYDYYNTGKADATTYYNPTYYQSLLDDYEEWNSNNQLTESGKKDLEELRELKANGWAAESKNEIKSVYKSMGIRIGVNVNF